MPLEVTWNHNIEVTKIKAVEEGRSQDNFFSNLIVLKHRFYHAQQQKCAFHVYYRGGLIKPLKVFTP